jgi:AcrR family transcriptional regulator
MTQSEPDLRVRRTRKLLHAALVELTIEKGFAAITVQDLAERAMINRSTFYRHFVDKQELLRSYLQDLYQSIDMEAATPGAAQPAGEPPAGLVSLLRHMRANAAFYRAMLGPSGDAAFCAQSFRGYLERGFRNLLPDGAPSAKGDAPPLNLSVTYLLHAGMGAILWWLAERSGEAFSPEQMAGWLLKLSHAVIGVSLSAGAQTGVRPRRLSNP